MTLRTPASDSASDRQEVAALHRPAQGLLGAFVLYLGGLAVADLLGAPHWVAILIVLGASALVWRSCAPHASRGRWLLGARAQWACFVAALCLMAWTIAPALLHSSVQDDQAPSIRCAAQALWHGADPWLEGEPECMASLAFSAPDLTPLRVGPFAEHGYPTRAAITTVEHRDISTGSSEGFPRYGYPPLAALWMLPVAYAGWQLTTWYILAVLVVLLALVWWRPTPNRMLLAIPQMLGLAMFVAAFNGDSEVLAYASLIVAFAWLDRPRASAIWMGVALLSNPLAWIVVPGWLTLILRTPNWRVRLGWLVGSTMAGLAPWLVWDHSLLVQLWHFVTLPEFPLGIALGALTHYPYPPSWPFFALFAAAVAGLAGLAWWQPKWRWACAAAVWGAFALSWRGNAFYFLPLFWLSPAILIGWWHVEHVVAAPVSVASGVSIVSPSSPRTDAPEV
jgi:hypothetical protein